MQSSEEISSFWDKRFGNEEYVYGTDPNQFFKSAIDHLPIGKILIPGAGEGRDAVYAASLGWDVYCLDLSPEGRNKAQKLAADKGVSIHYDIINISDATYPNNSFDVIASIFFHLPTPVRHHFFSQVVNWLKPDGRFIAELFSKDQLQFASGGPKDIDMLTNDALLTSELSKLKCLHIHQHETLLQEGSFHNGLASVVDYIGIKE